jgi:hypothetical protein
LSPQKQIKKCSFFGDKKTKMELFGEKKIIKFSQFFVKKSKMELLELFELFTFPY